MTKFSNILQTLSEQGNLRSIPNDTTNGSGLLDFSTNDYLGIATRHNLQSQFLANAANSKSLLTSSASRLLASSQNAYSALEHRLEELYGASALLFNSGYHANTGLVSALATKGTLIVADKLVHASIIDGITLSGAPMRRFRHADYSHLERILAAEAAKYECVLIIAESVYSMDGDRADISRLVDIKTKYPNALLYIDEAHALGVEGPKGLGMCAALPADQRNKVDVIVGTLGKACASMGAFAIMSHTLRTYALNRARSFIFSTALPPICCEWSLEVINLMTGMDSERLHLKNLSQQLAEGLKELGIEVIEPSHIMPVIVGSADRAVALAASLLEQGVKVLPIRTPTVPPGTERLRISLSAANTPEHITTLLSALKHSL